MIMEFERVYNFIILLSSVFNGTCALLFFNVFLEKRFSKKAFTILAAAAIVLLAAIKLVNYMVFGELDILGYETQVFRCIAKFLSAGIIFLYAFLLFKDNWIRKIIACVVPVVLLGVANIAHLILRYFLIATEAEYHILIALLSVILLNCFFYAAIRSSAKFMKSENFIYYKKDIPIILLAFAVSFVILLISCLMMSFFYSSVTLDEIAVIALSVLAIIAFDIIIISLVFRLAAQHRIQKETELQLIGKSLENQYANNIREQDQVFRRMRHDFKHHMCVMDVLLGQEKIDEAREYLKNYISLADINTYIETGNEYVNAILNSKITLAKNNGMAITSVIAGDIDGVDHVDLCNLLGNLLDNAIEAGVHTEDKTIVFKLVAEDQRIRINISNSISESVMERNLELKTSKSDVKNHGFGTKSVKEIASKYNGIADFYEEGNRFFANVVLVKIN
jgi:two-component system sensor histidine kinase AgrC